MYSSCCIQQPTPKQHQRFKAGVLAIKSRQQLSFEFGLGFASFLVIIDLIIILDYLIIIDSYLAFYSHFEFGFVIFWDPDYWLGQIEYRQCFSLSEY